MSVSAEGAGDSWSPQKPERSDYLWSIVKLNEIAQSAREELGSSMLEQKRRLSCSSCGTFLLETFSAFFGKVRCSSCRMDLAFYVSSSGEITSASVNGKAA